MKVRDIHYGGVLNYALYGSVQAKLKQMLGETFNVIDTGKVPLLQDVASGAVNVSFHSLVYDLPDVSDLSPNSFVLVHRNAVCSAHRKTDDEMA